MNECIGWVSSVIRIGSGIIDQALCIDPFPLAVHTCGWIAEGQDPVTIAQLGAATHGIQDS